MELSKRLLAVAEYVEEKIKVADIGTDHAYIPIYLAKYKKAKKIIAMDINKGPLNRAKKNIQKHKLDNLIETRLSNGLEQLKPYEVDTIIISGMGGLLINKIINKSSEIINTTPRLILQPQSEIHKVRYNLHDLGFAITDEKLIYEDGKFYFVIVADKGLERYNSISDYYYGKCLISKKDNILKLFLEKELNKKNQILHKLKKEKTNNSLKRKKELTDEINRIEEVLTCL
ncbi:MAG: tRNA (adenine(22)-N(1))-methyltransferase [Eubacteriales bacterium]